MVLAREAKGIKVEEITQGVFPICVLRRRVMGDGVVSTTSSQPYVEEVVDQGSGERNGGKNN